MVSSSPADESRRLGNLVSYIFDLSRPGPAREQVLRITDADTDVVYAQNVANCLHEWLSLSPHHHPLRRNILYLLRKVCRQGRVIPAPLSLTEPLAFDVNDPKYFTNMADVYQGILGDDLVAIKKLRLRLDNNSRSHFFREVVNWAHVKHQNILELSGVQLNERPRGLPPLLVSPWQREETLYKFVNRAGGNYQTTLGSRIRLAKEIAQALAYLHSLKIVHGDVKDTNILIGDDYRALVADFGLAIAGHNTQGADTTTGSRGSIPWMAPERFYDTQHRRRTPEMDVYAFGCICYMLCSGNHIFYGEREETLIDNVKRGYRPLKPVRSLDGSMVEDDYDRMMRKCWQPLPETRITMLNTLAYFEVDLGRVLVGSPSFIATSRDHYDAPPENRLGLSFKEGQRLDVTSCGGAMWTAVTEDQIVGEFPREIGHRCLNITVILQASVNADYAAEPPADDWSLPYLRLVRGEVLHIISLDKHNWIAKRPTAPYDIGLVRASRLTPHWPHPSDLRGLLTRRALFPYQPKDCHHHLCVQQSANVLAWSTHADDLWCVGYVLSKTNHVLRRGIIPAHVLRS